MIYDRNATIVFGTDTFLSGYAKFAHPYDFYSVRYVFAGAEKLKEETRKLYAEKYGVRIFEGYGATETSPALSLNTPMHNKVGSVGKLLPGITARLEKVEGIEEGSRLYVSGANIMLGYYLENNPAVLVPPTNNEYDTGDIVSIGNDGYIKICGRAKRFAKIAGEMVSLTLVEAYLKVLWPQHDHAVINIPYDKKGEQIILFTTKPNVERSEISNYTKAKGINELSIPKKIHYLDKLPVLGTGKTDYVALKEIAIN
jgi:acyl-[acyl-carrier-protein]-phospholipid O-acyltransferase/long-chain-fatty-acid--[acyl-carrier-protein] ligase